MERLGSRLPGDVQEAWRGPFLGVVIDATDRFSTAGSL